MSFLGLTSIWVGNSTFPLPGVLVDGYIDGSPGPANNPAGQSEFTGLTNGYGIYDVPGAQVDITWYLQFTFSNVNPACPNGSTSVDVPPGGYIETGNCITYET